MDNDQTSSFNRTQRPQKQQLTKEEKERFRGMLDSLFAISNKGKPAISRTVRHPSQIKKTDLPPLDTSNMSSNAEASEPKSSSAPSFAPSPRYALRNSPLTRGRSRKYWAQNTWEQRPKAETLAEFSQKVDRRYRQAVKEDETRPPMAVISEAIDSCKSRDDLLAWTQHNFLSLAVTPETPQDSTYEEILGPARDSGPGMFHSWPKTKESNLPTSYSTILLLIIRQYRLHFTDARMASNIFELVSRGLGPQSYLLGCDADVYSEMIKVAWLGDWEGIRKGTAGSETIGDGMGRQPLNLKLVESLLLRAESTGVPMHSNLRKSVEEIAADVERQVQEERLQESTELKWDAQSLHRLDTIQRFIRPAEEDTRKRVYNVH